MDLGEDIHYTGDHWVFRHVTYDAPHCRSAVGRSRGFSGSFEDIKIIVCVSYQVTSSTGTFSISAHRANPASLSP